mmetsp:Transcript_28194/g.80425  ORF Transcript_28194/g.80425 Transcript_28194/m.80425 type:complete len:203 (+) Transcript_28194:1430-2038(+)
MSRAISGLHWLSPHSSSYCSTGPRQSYPQASFQICHRRVGGTPRWSRLWNVTGWWRMNIGMPTASISSHLRTSMSLSARHGLAARGPSSSRSFRSASGAGRAAGALSGAARAAGPCSERRTPSDILKSSPLSISEAPALARFVTQYGRGPVPRRRHSSSVKWQQFRRSRSYSVPGQALAISSISVFISPGDRVVWPISTASR